MRLGSRLVLTATVACMVSLLSVIPASAAGSPGAPGIGDPYYPTMGNGGYDVSHYGVRLIYQPATDLLVGNTTILAKATQDLSSFNLDFLLKVKSVLVNNAVATYSQADGELTVRPPAELAAGSNMTVVVRYEDVPSAVVSKDAWIQAWRRTPDGAVAIGEPYSAEWWMPLNNHPADKATHDVSIEVPEGVEALSNGILVGKSQQRPGWVRWNWRSAKPQISYATFIAMGQFEVRTATSPSGLPVVTAYSELLGDRAGPARAAVERTPEVIEFLSGQFGPYPFEAQGGVVGVNGSDRRGYGMEHQTRPTYSGDLFDIGGIYTVVHELAHQWFGDSVAISRWRDLWLNEGAASFTEFLWSEHQGEGTAQELANYLYSSYPADDPFWQVLPGDPGAGRGKQFHIAVYYRGAMTMQALRNAVGDEDFFAILRTWLRQNQHGHGTTEEFIALSERISGESLTDLFNTWLYTPGRPEPGPVSLSSNAGPPASLEKIKNTIESDVSNKSPTQP